MSVFGFGAVPHELGMIWEGKIRGPIFRDSLSSGRYIAGAVVGHAAGEKIEQRYPLDMVIVSSREDILTKVPVRAIHSYARLIIMDEPTAAPGVEETERVLLIIERLREQRLTVLMISHNLEHVFRCADYIAVMHGGEVTAVLPASDVTRQDIVAHIMGSRI